MTHNGPGGAPHGLGQAIGITGAGTVVAIVLGVGTNKALALFIGPEGLGVVSQLQVLSALVMTVVAAGLPISLTRHIPELRSRQRPEQMYSLQRSALAFAIALAGMAGSLTLLFSRPLTTALFGHATLQTLVALCGVGGAVGGVGLVLQGVLNGYREVGALAVSAVAVSFGNLVLMASLSWRFGTAGAGAGIAALSVVTVGIYLLALRQRGRPLLGDGRARWDVLPGPLRLGAASLGTTLLNNATFLASRRLVIEAFGLAGNGWYQAVLTLTNQYFNVLGNSVSTYVLPTLSSLRTDPERVTELNRVGRAMFLLLTPTLAVLLAAKELIVTLLYSRAFLPAVEILEWQVVGGYFKMLTWTLGAPLWIVAGPGIIVGQELAWDVIYLSGLVGFGRLWGVPGIGIAFASAYVVLSLAVAAYVRHRLAFRWTGANRRLLATSLLLVVTAVPLTRMGLAGSGAVLLLLGVWAWVNVRRQDLGAVRGVVAGLRG